MLGKVEVQNDFGAKLLAPKLVRKLETVECDPRLSDDIVTKDFSSAIRNRSTVVPHLCLSPKNLFYLITGKLAHLKVLI